MAHDPARGCRVTVMGGLWALFGETVTRVSDGLEIPGCSLQSASSVEPRDGGAQRVVTNLILFVPPEHAARLSSLDVLNVRGVEYEVEGTPVGEHSVFTGQAANVPVTLRRITG